jgi:hypothetical protein
LVLLVVSTVAFWPAFKGSIALNEAMKVLPRAMLEAFAYRTSRARRAISAEAYTR